MVKFWNIYNIYKADYITNCDRANFFVLHFHEMALYAKERESHLKIESILMFLRELYKGFQIKGSQNGLDIFLVCKVYNKYFYIVNIHS